MIVRKRSYEYMGSGPAYPWETDHEAMAHNAIDALTGHMTRIRQAIRPGMPIQDEPVDSAGHAGQETARTADPFAARAAFIRASLRPGLTPHLGSD